MYVHPLHAWPRAEEVLALVRSDPLGAWVQPASEGLLANHLPWLLDADEGPQGVLRGHVARANPVWRALGEGRPSVVMFRGPQAYITPGWYPGKAAHGRVVPTWNYAAANAHGVARAVHDRDALLQLLQRLTDTHEAGRPNPWRVDDAPDDFIQALLQAIVGIEIPVTRWEAKLKASQDEAPEDRQGTVDGLRALACPQAQAVADQVERALRGDGPPTPA